MSLDGSVHSRTLGGADWHGDVSPDSEDKEWMKEIEKVFIPSRHCRQCHDRHFEEWKGMRERTEDLKSFGRVDGALLHGTALKSPVFRTVLGLWMQTTPSQEEKNKCLGCHVPAVTVFPQHTDRIVRQVLAGPKHVKVEGIGCTACHLINSVDKSLETYPAFNLRPGRTMFGPYAGAEDNMVHPSKKAKVYEGANYCAACHFSKVADVTQSHLNGPILQDLVCQDCHMEQSTGSSTNKRGRLSRPIGRHWFQGVVMPGIMLSNRNVQAEWATRLDIDVTRQDSTFEGTVHIRNGNLTHMFPGGDPVLKQFFVTVTLKDSGGEKIGMVEKKFTRSYGELMEGPIPQPLVNGGTSRNVPFKISIPENSLPAQIEAMISYALIPEPGVELKNQYLATLKEEKDRREAENIIEQYTSRRLLTFRTKSLDVPSLKIKNS